jgi:predicted DCC family thiol-disulfide oxidoreductase YuxK
MVALPQSRQGRYHCLVIDSDGSRDRHVVLYDADCGFCRWSLGRILARDRAGVLRPLALQDPEAEHLLAGMDREQRMASWHLVMPEGRVYSGGAAVAPLFRLLPRGRLVAALATLFPGVTGAVYRLVARNRGRLGRLLRVDSCSLERRP